MKIMLRVFFLILLCVPHLIRAQCPVVNLGPDTLVCVGTAITLDAENAGATYLWSDGSTAPRLETFFEGKYSVEVTLNGCTIRDTINVVSLPVLWSDFTFQKVSGCTPVKYKFSDKSTACESTISGWLWDFGDGTTSTERNPEHDFNTQAQFNVKLTVTDLNGNSIRRSKKVNVVPSSLSIDLGADTTICFGSALILDAGISGASYTWSTGETTQQIAVSDDGDYSVTVNSAGCIAKDTLRLFTSASALNKWSYVKGTECLPVQVTFSDSSVAFCGQSIESWYWEFGDGTSSTAQHPVHGFTSTDSFLVRLTVTTTSGSASTTTKKIGIGNTLHVVDIPSQLKVCTGESLVLDAGVANAQYNWSPSFGVGDVHERNTTIKPMINSWYFVEVTKCMVSVTDSVYVIVDSISKPHIDQQLNTLTATNAAAYEWYIDGIKIDGANNKTLRLDRKGHYTVKIINKSGCEQMSDPQFFMPYSGKEKAIGMVRIKCSPNPTNGRVSVLISEISGKPAKLAVYDSYGGILLTTFVTSNVTQLNLLTYPKGLYYVEVNINNKKNIVPVVIQ